MVPTTVVNNKNNLKKGVNPAAGSPTATLLRLRSSYQTVLDCSAPFLFLYSSSLAHLERWEVCHKCVQDEKIRKRVDATSNPLDFQSVTGGEYKAQVQIHRGVLIHDY